MYKLAFWLLLLGLFVAGYATRAEQEARRTVRGRAAADSVLRDAQAHIAGLERSNHQLADSLARSDSVTVMYRHEADRAAERAKEAEARAETIRVKRGTIALAREPIARDSIAYVRGQLIEADLENTELRIALEERKRELAAKDSIDRIRERDVALLRTATAEATAQLSRTMDALEAARLVVVTSEPCRLPLGIPCPSRKAVAISTAAALVLTFVARRPAREASPNVGRLTLLSAPPPSPDPRN